MAQCLVTKLKSTIDNDDLLELGALRVRHEYDSVQPYAQGITHTAEATNKGARIVGDGTFSNGTKAITGESFTSSAGNYDIIVFDKYTLVNIFSETHNISYGLTMNINDLKYSPNLKKLGASRNTNGSTESTGDLSTFANFTKLEVLVLNDSQITGDIANLKNSINLSKINIYNSCISGALEDLLNGLATNNKTTDLRVIFGGYPTANVTYQGKVVTAYTDSTFKFTDNGDGTSSWSI